ncbi:hypothetical protein D3C72_2046080 [compost metagenome]
MISAQLLDACGTEPIGPAVADPGQLEVGAIEAHRHQGGAHATATLILLGLGENRGMRAPDGRRQILPALSQAAQCLQRQGTGDLAALMTAHAVGHRPQAQRRATQQGILVVLAHAAHSRQRSVFRP